MKPFGHKRGHLSSVAICERFVNARPFTVRPFVDNLSLVVDVLAVWILFARERTSLVAARAIICGHLDTHVSEPIRRYDDRLNLPPSTDLIPH